MNTIQTKNILKAMISLLFNPRFNIYIIALVFLILLTSNFVSSLFYYFEKNVYFVSYKNCFYLSAKGKTLMDQNCLSFLQLNFDPTGSFPSFSF